MSSHQFFKKDHHILDMDNLLKRTSDVVENESEMEESDKMEILSDSDVAQGEESEDINLEKTSQTLRWKKVVMMTWRPETEIWGWRMMGVH